MKTRSTTLPTVETEVRSLLTSAADYAAASVKAVVTQLPENERKPRKVFYDCARLIDGLEVHFLFPNLTGTERKMLTSLLEVRRALLVCGRQSQRRSRASTAAAEQTVDTLLRKFRALRAQVRESQLDRRLTPDQKEILRFEFLAEPATMC